MSNQNFLPTNDQETLFSETLASRGLHQNPVSGYPVKED